MALAKEQSLSEKTQSNSNSKTNGNPSPDIRVTVSDQTPPQSNTRPGQSGRTTTTVSLPHGPCTDARTPPLLQCPCSPRTLIYGVISVILLVGICELTTISFNRTFNPWDDEPPFRVHRAFPTTSSVTEKTNEIQVLHPQASSTKNLHKTQENHGQFLTPSFESKNDEGVPDTKQNSGDEKTDIVVKKGNDEKEVPPQEKETPYNSPDKEFNHKIEKAHLTIGTTIGKTDEVGGKKEDNWTAPSNRKMKLVIIKPNVKTTLAPDEVERVGDQMKY